MLSIVGTPIGNLKDITLRALETLQSADVIVCEDTRSTIILLKHFNIPQKPLISFYEGVEISRIDEIMSAIINSSKVVLVSENGMPLISDPGYKLVRKCLEVSQEIDVIPGPTAVITGLVYSGLPPDKFIFLGFLPEKVSHREKLLTDLKESLKHINATVIIYVSPHKIKRDLETVIKIFGDIEVVLTRELTKIYQERFMGRATEAILKYKNPRGEFVLLFHLDLNA